MRFLRCLSLLLFLTAPVTAWNAPGHKVVALIAMEELTPEVRAQVNEMLSHHPFPEARQIEGASVWPDQVRQHPEYHRGPWHYGNEPVFLDGFVGDAFDGGQIVEAIELNLSVLSDPSSQPVDRAIALAWIVHCVGDIHQPMHAINGYSPDTPHGDRGGNEFLVTYRGEETNLHRFWDSVGGRFWQGKTDQDLKTVATELSSLYPADAMVDLADPNLWLHESHLLARSLAYPQAIRKQPLDEAYQRYARTVSEQRVTLAGHRLAAVLEKLLGSP